MSCLSHPVMTCGVMTYVQSHEDSPTFACDTDEGAVFPPKSAKGHGIDW